MDWNLNRLLKLPNMIIIKVQEIEDMICLHLESIKDGINVIVQRKCNSY